MTQKIAVILLNLGGPDQAASIRPFLKNFFMDPAIIGAPFPIRWMISRYIAWKRGRPGGPAEQSYGMMGGKSPLLDNTISQAKALQEKLNSDAKQNENADYIVHVVMRYWHPRADQVIQTLKQNPPNHIILMPLYPQFSTTTTGSSVAEFQQEMIRLGLSVPIKTVCCYPDQKGFITASTDQIKLAYQTMRADYPHLKPPRVLFSAHGLPEKIIAGGDPYQMQCEKTAALIAAQLSNDLIMPNLDWQVCYQSRVGPLQWIKPSTDDALRRAGADQVPVIIYPHAFVSEHVETLVEIEHEYRDLAREVGVPVFARASTVMTHPDFIAGLADMVVAAQTSQRPLAPGVATWQCGDRWVKCPCRAAA